MGDVEAGDDFAEDGVVGWEGIICDHDEELGAVGVATGVGHGEPAIFVDRAFVRTTLERNLFGRHVLDLVVGELITRTTRASAEWIAALDHEAWDDAVEDGAIVKMTIDEIDKIGSGVGAHLRAQLNHDVAEGGFDADFFVNFGGREDTRKGEGLWGRHSRGGRRSWSG